MTVAPPLPNKQPTNALELVQRYGEKHHLIAPCTDRFSEGSSLIVPSATQVRIDPNPEHGEVFRVGAKKIDDKWVDQLTLARPALERIAQAAGLTWDARLTRPLTLTRDYIVYQAVGVVRLPDGTPMRIIGTREIDMEVIEDESRQGQARKLLGRKDGEYNDLRLDQRAEVDRAVRAEVLMFRKHRLARAETGAKLRAIRSLGLKSTYTAAELAQPYVVVRWSLNPEHARSQTERAALWGDWTGPLPADPLPALEIHDDALDEIHGLDEGSALGVVEAEEMEGDEAEAETPADELVALAWCEHLELVLGLTPRRQQELRLHHAKAQRLAGAAPEALEAYCAWLREQLPKT